LANHTRATEAKNVEIIVLVISVAKWAALAGVTGALGGAAVAAFLMLLEWGVEHAGHIGPWWFMLPVAGLIGAALIHYVSPESYGHGTEAVIRAVNEQDGEIPIRVAPIKALATIISISFGASAGKEGPAAQIAGAVISQAGRALRLAAEDRTRLTMCALAAAFGVAMGAPMAGALFAIEALRMGDPFYVGILPAVIASSVSCIVARWLGWWHPLAAALPLPGISAVTIAQVIAGAVCLGLVAWLYIEAEEGAARMFHRLRVPPPVRTLIGGIVLVLLTLGFSSEYLGLGEHLIDQALAGASIPLWAFALKILFVAVTLGSGFSGGAMTPLLVIGATAGNAFGRILGLAPGFGAAIGIAGLLGGAANAPLTAAALGLEAFGPAFGIYGLLAAVVSYTVSGHRSINATQHLGRPKSTAFTVDVGHVCEEHGHVHIDPRIARQFPWLRSK
jgi:H+/Cl- antiporter ClcA